MKKACLFCEQIFRDGEDITIVYDGLYGEIPSSIVFRVTGPTEIRELFHPECYALVTTKGLENV